MHSKKIVIPLPNYGFDPTEVAIPWQLISQKDIHITFTTPEGKKASADALMLSGKKLGIWKSVLQAQKSAVEAYQEMEKSDSFCNPIPYKEAKEANFDAIILPGGHDKGVKEYLESELLQQLVANFFAAKKPVAAICHGVVLAARSMDLKTNKSVIYRYKTTALLQTQELLAYKMTQLWLQDYYLTYPENTVEKEVTAALENPNHFIKGPTPILRDNLNHLNRGFIVKDKNYLSAR